MSNFLEFLENKIFNVTPTLNEGHSNNELFFKIKKYVIGESKLSGEKILNINLLVSESNNPKFCKKNEKLNHEYGEIIGKLKSSIQEVVDVFEDYKVKINSIECGKIEESKKDRLTIRNLVKDIINVYKNNDAGEYELPHIFGEDEPYYDNNTGTYFSVELHLNEDDSIDSFYVDGNYYGDDETLEIIINYNPENKIKVIYDLIGNLNELFAHEITHFRQKQSDYKFPKKEPSKSYKYYTQNHEIEAQYNGFKRHSKVNKMPFETVVRNWFEKYKKYHNLNDKEQEKVIQKILNYKP